jgi:hypothetical protein
LALAIVEVYGHGGVGAGLQPEDARAVRFFAASPSFAVFQDPVPRSGDLGAHGGQSSSLVAGI